MTILIEAQNREAASSELFNLVEQRLESAFPGESLKDMAWGDVATELETGNFRSAENDRDLAAFLREAESLWFEYQG